MTSYMTPMITDITWLDEVTLRVEFSSTLDMHYHQLYAGRELVGKTEALEQRVIIAQVLGVTLPIHLQVIAVGPGEIDTDYGDDLPTRPYNRARLSADLSGLADDASYVVLTAGTTPGGAVSSSNKLAKFPFGSGSNAINYQDDTRETGTWNYALTAYDKTENGGNASTAATLSVALVSYPEDVEGVSQTSRIDADADEGILTVTWGA